MSHRLLDLTLRWGPVVGWMALLFVFSSEPNLRVSEDQSLDFVLRKIGHAAVYAVLLLLVLRALRVRGRAGLALALTIVALYAVSDEIHQGFVSNRHASPLDVAIDVSGALVALAAWLWFTRGRTGRQPVRDA